MNGRPSGLGVPQVGVLLDGLHRGRGGVVGGQVRPAQFPDALGVKVIELIGDDDTPAASDA